MIDLKEIYQDNINWLNFAELKNGALLTVSCLFLQISLSIDTLWVKSFFAVVYSIIIIITSISFIPFLNSRKFIKNLASKFYSKKYSDSFTSKNIVFYVNIFLSSKDIYVNAIKYISCKDELDRYEMNYVDQIIAISAIASIKYYLFNVSMHIFLLCFIVFNVLLVIA